MSIFDQILVEISFPFWSQKRSKSIKNWSPKGCQKSYRFGHRFLCIFAPILAPKSALLGSNLAPRSRPEGPRSRPEGTQKAAKSAKKPPESQKPPSEAPPGRPDPLQTSILHHFKQIFGRILDDFMKLFERFLWLGFCINVEDFGTTSGRFLFQYRAAKCYVIWRAAAVLRVACSIRRSTFRAICGVSGQTVICHVHVKSIPLEGVYPLQILPHWPRQRRRPPCVMRAPFCLDFDFKDF